jgi:coenzyme F420-reducing hydrogenase alpha subunit
MEICKGEIKKEEMPEITPRPGRGVGAIEVPRGTLWHDYTLDERGTITDANIITPTAQNLYAMQEDIRKRMPSLLKKKREEIVLDVEKLIRNYDPCFSCSAHFLEVKWL